MVLVNGDIRNAFSFPAVKRRRIEAPMLDNITLNTSDESGNELKDASRQPDDEFATPRASKQLAVQLSAPNQSFQSTSSLSAPPPSSSQLSAISKRSQRLWQDGEPLVTNSSSEAEQLDDGDAAEGDGWSESDSGDDDDGDIEMMIARKRQSIATEKEDDQAQQGIDTPEPDHNTRSLSTSHRKPKIKQPVAYPTPPKSSARNTLADILNQKRKREALEARLANLEARDKHGEERYKAFQALDDDDDEMVVKAEAMLEAEDDADIRLKLALKRMNAMEHEVRFYFFDTVPETDPTRLPFPPVADTWDKWMFVLKDDISRTQSALSGFLTDLCYHKPLPPELQEWLLGEVLFEEREELSEACVHILAACSVHDSLGDLIDGPMLRDSMTRLGAKDEIVYERNDDDGQSDDIPDVDLRPAKGGRRGLVAFLLLLSQLSGRLSTRTLELALYFCALILIDDHVATSIVVTTRVQQTLCDLLEGVNPSALQSTTAAFAKRTFARLADPVLAARLLSRLPPTTERMAVLKRQMAYAWITHGPLPEEAILSQLSTWSTVIAVLRGADFAITSATNYAALGACVSMLDLAIGTGFGDSSLPARTDQEEDTTSATAADAVPQVQLFFEKRKSATPPVTDEERAFNAEVDRLAASLRKNASLIRDSGATHVRRRECKGAIERLLVRLDFAVRTRPRVKKHARFPSRAR